MVMHSYHGFFTQIHTKVSFPKGNVYTILTEASQTVLWTGVQVFI